MNESSNSPPQGPLIRPGTGELGQEDPSAESTYGQETGFISLSRITGGHQAIAGPQSPKAPAPPTLNLRLRAAIWGGATGLIFGALLGVLNSLLQGQPPSPLQRPLMILALGCCLSFALTAAFMPSLCHSYYLQLKRALSSASSSS